MCRQCLSVCLSVFISIWTASRHKPYAYLHFEYADNLQARLNKEIGTEDPELTLVSVCNEYKSYVREKG